MSHTCEGVLCHTHTASAALASIVTVSSMTFVTRAIAPFASCTIIPGSRPGGAVALDAQRKRKRQRKRERDCECICVISFFSMMTTSNCYFHNDDQPALASQPLTALVHARLSLFPPPGYIHGPQHRIGVAKCL